jgi:hypothetical protein
MGRAVEVVATLAIVVAVGAWNQLIFAGLARHRSVSAAVIALAIVATIVVLRRDYRGSDPGVRVAVTRDIAYLAALVLIFWEVVAPGRWVLGSATAMTIVALGFDAFTRLAARTS